jgi:transposase
MKGASEVIFVGNDWSEAHHDVWVMDPDGQKLAAVRLPEGLAGLARLHQLVATYAQEPAQVAIGVETDRGLWVAALVSSGYQVYAINPLSVARYRERHTLSGGKSDLADAKVLADLVRTDRHNHRQVAGDSDLAEAVKVLTRAHQNLIWERQRHTNRLRSSLREYYPAALTTFDDLDHPETLTILAKAPTPTAGQSLTLTQIKTWLRQAGRQRNLDTRAATIKQGLAVSGLQAPKLITQASAATTRATVAVIAELNRQIKNLETELAAHFEQHPDAEIITSIPGLGNILGARVLAEFGDDPNRYHTAKSAKNYAGTSPITRSSGKQKTVSARWIRNRRLIAAIDLWAFAALTPSPGARTFYDHHRQTGHTHHQALRALGNRLVGIYWGCLQHHTPYNENTAWAHHQPHPNQHAA